ncbi:hypothetical protein, partial [Heyndrickxia ginsengihumi]|uniref:hypothetical protein n=1 Tax=Heyndrickxia ginsengihumi TaxID=363870 RepID=UPI003D247BA8
TGMLLLKINIITIMVWRSRIMYRYNECKNTENLVRLTEIVFKWRDCEHAMSCTWDKRFIRNSITHQPL